MNAFRAPSAGPRGRWGRGASRRSEATGPGAPRRARRGKRNDGPALVAHSSRIVGSLAERSPHVAEVGKTRTQSESHAYASSCAWRVRPGPCCR